MIEICLKYNKDLGLPESLLLIEKYKKMFGSLNKIKQLENDYSKRG